MSYPEIHVILLAAGDGKRTETTIPKQFLIIAGLPLLFNTFQAFSYLREVTFHLVLNDNQVNYWKDLCSEYNFHINHTIVSGGPTRFHSVKSGLRNIPDNAIVLIHDGVRPFPSSTTINNVIEITSRKGNAIPVIDISDSVREVKGVYNKVVDRETIKLVQTPQGFIASKIKDAYQLPYNELFTDDSQVLEATGVKINTVMGNADNIKVTTQIDIIIAEAILKDKGL